MEGGVEVEEDAGAGTGLISKSIHVRVMEECIDWMPCCVNGLMWHSLRNHGSLVKHGEFPVLLAEHMVLRDWLVRVGLAHCRSITTCNQCNITIRERCSTLDHDLSQS